MKVTRSWSLVNDDEVWPRVITNDDKGTCCEVRLNLKDGLIKRKFSIDSITVNGKPTTQHPELGKKRIRSFFLNEIKWLNILKDSGWVSEIIDCDTEDQWVIQKFYGPDLLMYNWEDNRPFIKEQVLEMYRDFIDTYDMIKCNGSLSNMSYNPNTNRILAIDFKWAESLQWRNPEHKNKTDLLMEIRSYWKWLSKIDKELPYELLMILDDFDEVVTDRS